MGDPRTHQASYAAFSVLRAEPLLFVMEEQSIVLPHTTIPCRWCVSIHTIYSVSMTLCSTSSFFLRPESNAPSLRMHDVHISFAACRLLRKVKDRNAHIILCFLGLGSLFTSYDYEKVFRSPIASEDNRCFVHVIQCMERQVETYNASHSGKQYRYLIFYHSLQDRTPHFQSVETCN